MKKKNNKLVGVITVLIIMIVTGFLISQQLGFTQIGGTVMSISDAKYINKDGEFTDAYLIDVIVNGKGESISAYITPEDIENTGADVIPEAFKVTFELEEARCEYRIEETDDIIYRLYQATSRAKGWGIVGLSQDCPYDLNSLDLVKDMCNGEIENECNRGQASNICYDGKSQGYPTGTGVISPGSKLPQTANCNNLVDIQTEIPNPQAGGEIGEWCYAVPSSRPHDTDHWRVTHIAGEPFYDVRNIGTRPFLDYQVKVKVENSNGEVIEGLLDSKTKVANLGSYGRIKLVGSLLGDEFCDNPAIEYKIVENEGETKFISRDLALIYKSDLTNLRNFDNNYYKYEDVDPGVGADGLWGYVSGANGVLNDIYSSDLDLPFYIEDNVVISPPETAIAYPEVQLLLESEFLGISEDKREELRNAIDDLQSELDKIKEEDSKAVDLLSDIVELEKLIDSVNLLDSDTRDTIESKINNLYLKASDLSSSGNRNIIEGRIDLLNDVFESSVSSISIEPVIDIPFNGIPKILSLELQDEIFDRDKVPLVVEVINIGTDAEAFDVSMTCDTGLSFGATPISLSPNAVGFKTININGDAGDYDCVVFVVSANNPDNYDEKELRISIKQSDLIDEPEFNDTYKIKDEPNYLAWFLGGALILAILFIIYSKLSKKKNKKKR